MTVTTIGPAVSSSSAASTSGGSSGDAFAGVLADVATEVRPSGPTPTGSEPGDQPGAGEPDPVGPVLVELGMEDGSGRENDLSGLVDPTAIPGLSVLGLEAILDGSPTQPAVADSGSAYLFMAAHGGQAMGMVAAGGLGGNQPGMNMPVGSPLIGSTTAGVSPVQGISSVGGLETGLSTGSVGLAANVDTQLVVGVMSGPEVKTTPGLSSAPLSGSAPHDARADLTPVVGTPGAQTQATGIVEAGRGNAMTPQLDTAPPAVETPDTATTAVAGTLPTAPTVAVPTPAARQTPSGEVPTMVDQLGPHLRALSGAKTGTHVLSVLLDPSHLGEVRIVAHISADQVRIDLTGAGDEARATLRSALDDLRRDLENAGFNAEMGLSDRRSSDGQERDKDQHPVPQTTELTSTTTVDSAPRTVRGLDLIV